MEVPSEGEMGIELKPQAPKQALTTPGKSPAHTTSPSKATEPSTPCSHGPKNVPASNSTDKEEALTTPTRPSATIPLSTSLPSSSTSMPASRNPPKAPKKPTVPRFTRSKAAAGNVPYEFEKLNDSSKAIPQDSKSVNWTHAMYDLQKIIDNTICDPDNIDPVDCSQISLDFDTGLLPEPVY
ncbi:hypothetical protein OPQ81_011167 [Rhizoctonia solani]|nr:hypothetical protein OPQ81_011167 [Rhizoctonia solani]